MTQAQTAPTWFKVITIIALVWNLLGVAAFAVQMMMTPEMLAALPEDQQALIASTPAWVNIAFACAVFGGALGCIFLLMKKSLAVVMFAISLVGILAQNVNSFFLSNAIEVYGAGSAIMPMFVIAFAVFLLWMARHAKAKEWIN